MVYQLLHLIYSVNAENETKLLVQPRMRFIYTNDPHLDFVLSCSCSGIYHHLQMAALSKTDTWHCGRYFLACSGIPPPAVAGLPESAMWSNRAPPHVHMLENLKIAKKNIQSIPSGNRTAPMSHIYEVFRYMLVILNLSVKRFTLHKGMCFLSEVVYHFAESMKSMFLR